MTQLSKLLAPRSTGFARLTAGARDLFAAEAVDPVAPIREDRARIFEPLGMYNTIDQWQRQVMNSDANNIMLLCSRQSGKSTVMAACALLEALLHPWAEVLLVSRTLRQSTELMRKVKEFWRGVTGGRVKRRVGFNPVSLNNETKELESLARHVGWDGAALVGDEFKSSTKDRQMSQEFPNGSRVTCLPCNPDGIVGFSAITLLIYDEAARLPDHMAGVGSAFLAASEHEHGRPGRKIVASTPFGKRGWFWEAWDKTERTKAAHARGATDRVAGIDRCPWSDRDAERRLERDAWRAGHDGQPARVLWETYRVTADQCPRISQQFLEDERAMIGARWYQQEYETLFVDLVDSVFSHEDVHSLADATIKPRRLWCE